MLDNCEPLFGSAARASALLITVNYKDGHATIDLLASIHHAQDSSRVDVLVVDNGSSADELSELKEAVAKYPNVDLMKSGQNRGYFGAAKFGLSHYLERKHSLPDWVIVCNHDLLLPDAGFFHKLFNMDSKSVGMIAPRIQVEADGIDQNPFMRRRPSTLYWGWLRLIYSNYAFTSAWHSLSRLKRLCKNLVKNNFRLGKDHPVCREVIYAPHGAFMIFSKRFFDAGGYLDDNLFLYWEEISVSEICNSLRLPIVYEPVLRIHHKEHLSIGDGITRFTYNCYKNSFDYIRSKFLAKASLFQN